MSVHDVPAAHGDQKRVLNPLELELQMVLATMWVLAIEPGSSRRVVTAISPALGELSF